MQKIVINLHNRPKKLLHTLNELRKVNLSDLIILFEAKTPEYAKSNFHNILHKDAYQNIKNTRSTTIIPNFKAVACALSHISCWKYIIDNNINDCIIIEDDIEIKDPELFKMEYANFTQTVKSNSSGKPLFITFNSKNFPCNFDAYPYYDTNYINPYGLNGFRTINKPFTGLHFYYLNRRMAKFLWSNIKLIKYQLDIEIGLLAAKRAYPLNNDIIFCNLHTKTIIQSKKFKSDIQYYPISIEELGNILKLPDEIIRIIYEFIPNCYKMIRSDENFTLYPYENHNNNNIIMNILQSYQYNNY